MGFVYFTLAIALALSVSTSNALVYSDPTKVLNNVYDFIVVGGGAGGAVVAKRLAEVRNLKVLLIEAGPR